MIKREHCSGVALAMLLWLNVDAQWGRVLDTAYANVDANLQEYAVVEKEGSGHLWSFGSTIVSTTATAQPIWARSMNGTVLTSLFTRSNGRVGGLMRSSPQYGLVSMDTAGVVEWSKGYALESSTTVSWEDAIHMANGDDLLFGHFVHPENEWDDALAVLRVDGNGLPVWVQGFTMPCEISAGDLDCMEHSDGTIWLALGVSCFGPGNGGVHLLHLSAAGELLSAVRSYSVNMHEPVLCEGSPGTIMMFTQDGPPDVRVLCFDLQGELLWTRVVEWDNLLTGYDLEVHAQAQGTILSGFRLTGNPNGHVQHTLIRFGFDGEISSAQAVGLEQILGIHRSCLGSNNNLALVGSMAVPWPGGNRNYPCLAIVPVDAGSGCFHETITPGQMNEVNDLIVEPSLFTDTTLSVIVTDDEILFTDLAIGSSDLCDPLARVTDPSDPGPSVNVSPNPFSSAFEISLPVCDVSQLSLVDMQGREVRMSFSAISEDRIQVAPDEDLRAGLYLLRGTVSGRPINVRIMRVP